MNPIDKITDSSFTSSTKGLLTLFCVGLFHIVIGVDLTEAKVEIPWFPTVHFLYTERIVYLYWLAVAFVSYRFTLHHMPLLKRYYFESLSQFLKYTTAGDSLVRRHIYPESMSYTVAISTSSEPVQSIKIEHHGMGDRDWEHLATLEFRFNKEYDFICIQAHENSAYSIDEIAYNKPEKKKGWGFSSLTEDDGQNFLESSRITDRKLRYELKFGVLKRYLKIIMTNKETFDLAIPLLLNLVLFVAWSICQLGSLQ